MTFGPRRRPRGSRLFGLIDALPLIIVFGAVGFLATPPARQAMESFATTEGVSETVSIPRGGDAWRGTSSGLKGGKRVEAHPASAGATLIDSVTRVRDGDTIVVGLIPIRIANLDCAEKGTRAGEPATRRVKQLVSGQTLRCRLEGRRSYDREIGLCSLPDGRDIGEILIAESLCGRWR